MHCYIWQTEAGSIVPSALTFVSVHNRRRYSQAALYQFAHKVLLYMAQYEQNDNIMPTYSVLPVQQC